MDRRETGPSTTARVWCTDSRASRCSWSEDWPRRTRSRWLAAWYRIVALGSLCFAIPLAVFGAEHLSGPELMLPLVPVYMPWRLFWVYFVGIALIAASLSIATRTGVRWSGLLFGIMMFLFVATIHLPGALARHDRVLWVIVFREMSFAGAAWILAEIAMDGWRGRVGASLIKFD